DPIGIVTGGEADCRQSECGHQDWSISISKHHRSSVVVSVGTKYGDTVVSRRRSLKEIDDSAAAIGRTGPEELIAEEGQPQVEALVAAAVLPIVTHVRTTELFRAAVVGIGVDATLELYIVRESRDGARVVSLVEVGRAGGIGVLASHADLVDPAIIDRE